jgi:hypothetical protein
LLTAKFHCALIIIKKDTATSSYLFTTTTASPVDVKKAIAVINRPISLNFRTISLHLLHYFFSKQFTTTFNYKKLWNCELVAKEILSIYEDRWDIEDARREVTRSWDSKTIGFEASM